MNCKPGDLAVIVGSDFRGNNGTIVEVAAPYVGPLPGPAWWVIVQTYAPMSNTGGPCRVGERVHCEDACLRPIPGEDAKDETLQWLPAPRREEEVA